MYPIPLQAGHSDRYSIFPVEYMQFYTFITFNLGQNTANFNLKEDCLGGLF